MTVALYPGTFDPVTLGHIDIVRRAASLFERLIVGIYETPQKRLTFSTQQRVDMMCTSVEMLRNVKVVSYDGLTVHLARKLGAQVLVRGLRVISDFEHEYQMALTNQKLAPDIDTLCLMTSLEYAFVSSSMAKEIFAAGGCVDGMVPPHVVAALRSRFPDE